MPKKMLNIAKTWWPVLFAPVFITAELAAQEVETLVIPEIVAYGADTPVNVRVKRECRLEEKISQFIQEYTKGTYAKIVHEKPSSGTYHVLTAEIIDVLGRGGGAWSGYKSITIKGQLTDHTGKVLGTFQARRYSGGGAFAGYKGTCSILGRCTKALGKDVAYWLQAPDMNATLGDY